MIGICQKDTEAGLNGLPKHIWIISAPKSIMIVTDSSPLNKIKIHEFILI